jgi:hypothetical protein
MLHMYPRQGVQVWAGILEWVDHVVRHVRAGARRRVDPSVPQRYKPQCYTSSGDKYGRSCTHLDHLFRHYRYSAVAKTTWKNAKHPQCKRLLFLNHSNLYHPASVHGWDRVREQFEGTVWRDPSKTQQARLQGGRPCHEWTPHQELGTFRSTILRCQT